MSAENDFTETNAKDSTVPASGFTVLEDVAGSAKLRPVAPTLPAWLRDPVTFDNNIGNTSPFSSLPAVDEEVIGLLVRQNYDAFFPVQSAVIPILLKENGCNNVVQPRDLCVSAPTGSGKTLAYTIPIIQSLKFFGSRAQLFAIIVLPVQDLAVQVHKVVKSFADLFRLRVALLAGQQSLADERMQLVEWNGFQYLTTAHIIVATPGRLVDHLNAAHTSNSIYSSGVSPERNETAILDLRYLKYLVLDEADQIMQELKADWLEHLDRALLQCHAPCSINYVPLSAFDIMYGPKRAQKLLFSATMTRDPRQLERMGLFRPQLVLSDKIKLPDRMPAHSISSLPPKAPAATVEATSDDAATAGGSLNGNAVVTAKYSLPESLSEHIIKCRPSLKPLYLFHLIYTLGYRRILCFCKSVENAHRLYMLTKHFQPPNTDGADIPQTRVTCIEMSSQIHARRRRAVVEQFSAGTVDVVFCTDVLSRGMDFESVQCVIQYDSPLNAESYVHRVGRTARAGKPGMSVMLIHSKNFSFYKKMLTEATGQFGPTNMKISEGDLQPMVPAYEAALEQLKQDVNEEKTGGRRGASSQHRTDNIKFQRRNYSGNKRSKRALNS